MPWMPSSSSKARPGGRRPTRTTSSSTRSRGKKSYGLNLDGKVSPNDFTSPDGTPGIDNEVYRAVGCIIGFRGPDGVEVIFQNKAISSDTFNRTMIELTGVDSWTKDDDVTVTIFRGHDRLLTDAKGDKVLPGGTQRIDVRWGKKLIQQVKGKIEDGTLTTVPTAQMVIPWQNLSVPSFQLIRDMRLVLKVSPTHAEGLLAGYADVDTYYRQLIRNDSTHHLSNGQISGISLYKALSQVRGCLPGSEDWREHGDLDRAQRQVHASLHSTSARRSRQS